MLGAEQKRWQGALVKAILILKDTGCSGASQDERLAGSSKFLAHTLNLLSSVLPMTQKILIGHPNIYSRVH